jgi:alpha-L-rhamnosidase
VGIILGNGRCVELYGYDFPKVIVQINIHYQDGSNEQIYTDSSWKISDGPIKQNGIYYGEYYDARLEMPGWDKQNFNETNCEPATETKGHNLASQMMQPVQITKILKPTDLYSPKPGVYIYDFGQNYSGFVKLIISGSRGTEITLRFAELIFEDGTLNTFTNRSASANEIYILKGEGEEEFQPHFTYHGFRYVEVTGFPGILSLENIEGYFFHSNVPKIGEFHCSNELINNIHLNIIWGQLSNLMSIPTDCPQRDERHGWMGDAQVTAEEAIFNFDMARFYSKYIRDIKLSQKPDGSISDVVPPYWKIYPADPAWGAAYMVLTWNLYWYYNDLQILEENYDSLKKYVDFLSNIATENIYKEGRYGDWCSPSTIVSKTTPIDLTSTWYYFHDTLFLSKMAKILKREKESELYTCKAEQIKDAFNNEFFKGGFYYSYKFGPEDETVSQTSNILPLYLKMEPDNKRRAILTRLLFEIDYRYDYHFDTGLIGTRYIADLLTEEGYPDVIYKMINKKSFPGYGYMIREGATTLWERWEKLEGGGMNSHNHIMLGSIDTWFYNTLLGIKAIEVGWKALRIKPFIPDDMQYATGSINTIKGKISVSWEKADKNLKLSITIPVGVRAETWIPVKSLNSEIQESTNTIWKNTILELEDSWISFKKATENYVIFDLGSGDYKFLIHN